MPRYIDADKARDNSTDPYVRIYLDSQPTADVAPVVHRHWITFNYLKNNMLLDENEFFQCSSCFHKVIKKTDYCSKCGARMDEEEKI